MGVAVGGVAVASGACYVVGDGVAVGDGEGGALAVAGGAVALCNNVVRVIPTGQWTPGSWSATKGRLPRHVRFRRSVEADDPDRPGQRRVPWHSQICKEASADSGGPAAGRRRLRGDLRGCAVPRSRPRHQQPDADQLCPRCPRHLLERAQPDADGLPGQLGSSR